MDPIAHTLLGATLAESGLKRLSRYATPALLLGANLPDLDVVSYFWGPDTALLFRRGWSHGVLAMLTLPLMLAGAFWLWHRWRGHRSGSGPPLRIGMLLLLCFLATWTHPLLDWMNTYGVRLLMPFDGRWFYGDTLFIIDPWFWLLTAAGVVLARSGSKPSIAGWGLLAVLTSMLILSSPDVPSAAKIIWSLGIAGIVTLRWLPATAKYAVQASRAALVLLIAYVGTAYGLARHAESGADGGEPHLLDVQANPAPARPWAHRVILVYPSHYQVITPEGGSYRVDRSTPDPVVAHALAQQSVRGFVNWMRFPYWEVRATETGWHVEIRDLRYAEPGKPGPGIGTVDVEVPRSAVEP